ncbi:MAG: SLBB domain-containing protein [Planctomycetales bacterium]|nr:SLBB domain-containing protein [Planctomycetales bacterium]
MKLSRQFPMDAFLKAILLTVFLSVVGCRTVADFDATSLPKELRAVPLANESADLTAIAQESINANQIYAGDMLEVSIGTGFEENGPQVWPLRVDSQGEVTVPIIGVVSVVGMSPTDAEHTIKQAAIRREIFKSPHVSVVIKQHETIAVRVAGEVKQPGLYDLPAAGSDVLAAIVAAGGLSELAGTKIEIRHPTKSQDHGVALASFAPDMTSDANVIQVDLRQSMEGPQNFKVTDGSVVMVHAKPKKSVGVLGLVRRPNSYDYPPDESLRVLDAVAMAGGIDLNVADKIHVIRQSPDNEDPVIIKVSYRKAKSDGDENLVLMPGDTVIVEETPLTMVVGSLRSFIRFGFSSGIPGL